MPGCGRLGGVISIFGPTGVVGATEKKSIFLITENSFEMQMKE